MNIQEAFKKHLKEDIDEVTVMKKRPDGNDGYHITYRFIMKKHVGNTVFFDDKIYIFRLDTDMWVMRISNGRTYWRTVTNNLRAW
jgi:hypothetical protein